MKIGILALQGCVEPHEKHLAALGVPSLRVRNRAQLEAVDGLILPGGESTTMLHLLRVFDMVDLFCQRAAEIPYWGVCAGAILMARELEGTVRGPGQKGLNIMDVAVERNAYGRQLESFTDKVELSDGRVEMATFIRAPKFRHWGESVTVLGHTAGEAVMLAQGRHLMTAFHPELSASSWCHEFFLERCREITRNLSSNPPPETL